MTVATEIAIQLPGHNTMVATKIVVALFAERVGAPTSVPLPVVVACGDAVAAKVDGTISQTTPCVPLFGAFRLAVHRPIHPLPLGGRIVCVLWSVPFDPGDGHALKTNGDARTAA